MMRAMALTVAPNTAKVVTIASINIGPSPSLHPVRCVQVFAAKRKRYLRLTYAMYVPQNVQIAPLIWDDVRGIRKRDK